MATGGVSKPGGGPKRDVEAAPKGTQKQSPGTASTILSTTVNYMANTKDSVAPSNASTGFQHLL